jgi:hypothetical protein
VGVFGSGIFDSDLARDVADAFQGARSRGTDGVSVCDAMLADYRDELGDPEAEAVIVLSLALLAAGDNCLTHDLQRRALELLADSGVGPPGWPEVSRFPGVAADDLRRASETLSAAPTVPRPRRGDPAVELEQPPDTAELQASRGDVFTYDHPLLGQIGLWCRNAWADDAGPYAAFEIVDASRAADPQSLPDAPIRRDRTVKHRPGSIGIILWGAKPDPQRWRLLGSTPCPKTRPLPTGRLYSTPEFDDGVVVVLGNEIL